MEWIEELAIYLASGLMMLLAGWLMWGVYKKKYHELYKEAAQDKTTLNKLISDFKNFKSETEIAIDKKGQEVRKWKRLSETISMTNEDSVPKSEVDKWKKKHKSLESELAVLKLNANSKQNVKEREKLQRVLEEAHLKIKKQDILLLKAKRESFPRNDSEEIKTLKKKLSQISKSKKHKSDKKIISELEALSHQNKKLKKKLKRLKRSFASKPTNQETIEITRSLDIKKLTDLLSNGSLMVSKRKVVKGNKK